MDFLGFSRFVSGGSDFQSLGLLRGVRMSGTGVALHFFKHRIAERAFGQHALDGLFENASREALLQLLEVGFVNAPRIAGVAEVLLVLGLVAGDTQLLNVYDNDEIASVDVRRVFSLVLAAQTACYSGGQTSQHFVGCIDNEPVSLDLMRLGRKGFHEFLGIQRLHTNMVTGSFRKPRILKQWQSSCQT
jgi:hypothetical protein